MRIPSATSGKARSAGEAISLMCAGIFCIVVNDALAKWFVSQYPPIQIIFMRNLLAIPMIAVIAFSIGGRAAFRTRHLGLHAVRGLLLVCGAYAFYVGLGILPLAEATSLIFAAPIFITALSVPLLREHVGWRRWAAVIVGFAGVLIIVRPGAAAFQPASLFVLVTAMVYALVMISARWIGRGEGMWTMMFYLMLFPTIFSGLIVPWTRQTLEMPHLALFLAMAIFGALGIALISQAFRLGEAAVVAPFDYTALIWASLLGWLVWGEIPGLWTYAGAAVIIASGIYIVLRETGKARGDESA